MTEAETLAQKLDAFNGDLAWETAALLRNQEVEIERLKDYAQWYGEAMTASNEAGFSGMSAEQTIREQAAEIERLRQPIREFIRRVESGEVLSKKSYAEFKKALGENNE